MERMEGPPGDEDSTGSDTGRLPPSSSSRSLTNLNAGGSDLGGAKDARKKGAESTTPAPTKKYFVCKWAGCHRPSRDLMDHIHRRHVEVGLRMYICEWEGCPRRRVRVCVRARVFVCVCVHAV